MSTTPITSSNPWADWKHIQQLCTQPLDLPTWLLTRGKLASSHFFKKSFRIFGSRFTAMFKLHTWDDRVKPHSIAVKFSADRREAELKFVLDSSSFTACFILAHSRRSIKK